MRLYGEEIAAVDPVLCRGRAKYEQQIRDGLADGDIARDEYKTGGHLAALEEFGMLGSHGIHVLRYQEPSGVGCPDENVSVRPSTEGDLGGRARINPWLGATEASNDAMVNVFVEEEFSVPLSRASDPSSGEAGAKVSVACPCFLTKARGLSVLGC